MNHACNGILIELHFSTLDYFAVTVRILNFLTFEMQIKHPAKILWYHNNFVELRILQKLVQRVSNVYAKKT